MKYSRAYRDLGDRGLRNETFTSLAQLRVRVRTRVDAYNKEPFQKREGTRASVFAAEEAPLLTELPATRVRDQHLGLRA
jgi:hypothetical protein